jgi:hypothetical protein
MLCFDIDNFEEAFGRDHLAIEHVESALALRGAIPARVDFPTRTFCVTVTNPDLGPREVLSILATYGFRARLKGEKDDIP